MCRPLSTMCHKLGNKRYVHVDMFCINGNGSFLAQLWRIQDSLKEEEPTYPTLEGGFNSLL